MNLFELSRIVSSESEVEKYLQQVGILKTFNECIHCGSSQISQVRRRNIKCYSCKREWSSKKFSVLENIRVDPGKFLLVVKCFVLKLPINTCADECKLDTVVVNKIYNNIREMISTINDSIDKHSGKVILVLIYDEHLQLFTTSFEKVNSSGERIASISFMRTKRSDRSYTYRIDEVRILKELPKSILDRLNLLITQFEEGLCTFRNRSARACMLLLGEEIFRINHNNEGIFEEILGKLSNNVGG